MGGRGPRGVDLFEGARRRAIIYVQKILRLLYFRGTRRILLHEDHQAVVHVLN